MRFSASDIATICNATLHGPDASLRGAGIDSRTIEVGQLFVPLVAERDGHDFIVDAVERSAAAYLTSQPDRAWDPVLPATAIEVADTAQALSQLGIAARQRITGPVVGITGSVGKTSTKDLCASVLRLHFARVAAAVKSFNNEIGVPLTLLNAPDDSDAAVIEMGARGIGHIARLCEVVAPTIGVVTAVGEGAHLEQFGDVAGVANAKGELVEALRPDGCAVLNADDPLVAAMASRTTARALLFGDHGEIRAEAVTLDERMCARFRLCSPWGGIDVGLGVPGRHMVPNALAAAAVALLVGVDLEGVATGLAASELSPWRMEITRTPGGQTVINDAYNANTMSMRAALDSLAEAKATRRLAVLGAMAELGEGSADAHLAVLRHARALGLEVVVVGTGLYGVEPIDFDEARLVVAALGPDTAVLIKASRVAGLERLASAVGTGRADA